MSTNHTSGNPHAGSAGHQGHDRQPVANGAKSTTRNPEPHEAASAEEVKRRSEEAAALTKKAHDAVDSNHPGPGRIEREKSKPNLQ